MTTDQQAAREAAAKAWTDANYSKYNRPIAFNAFIDCHLAGQQSADAAHAAELERLRERIKLLETDLDVALDTNPPDLAGILSVIRDGAGGAMEQVTGERDDLRTQLAGLRGASEAGIAYDKALQKRAVNGTVHIMETGGAVAMGDDLDSLYDDWIDKCRAVLAVGGAGG